MLRRRQALPALLRLFSTSCRRLPSQPHPPNTSTLPPPPVAKKVPFTVSAHGRSWSDPYHWMRDTSDPDLAALLAAENAYADAFVASAGSGGLRACLAAEMRARLPPSAASPPQPWGPWLYYQYVPNGMEYPVLSRKLRPSGGLEGSLLSYLLVEKRRRCYLTGMRLQRNLVTCTLGNAESLLIIGSLHILSIHLGVNYFPWR